MVRVMENELIHIAIFSFFKIEFFLLKHFLRIQSRKEVNCSCVSLGSPTTHMDNWLLEPICSFCISELSAPEASGEVSMELWEKSVWSLQGIYGYKCDQGQGPDNPGAESRGTESYTGLTCPSSTPRLSNY